MGLRDSARVYARAAVYGVAGDTVLPDVIGIMAERYVRRLRIYIGGGYGYVTSYVILSTIDNIRDPRKLVNIKAMLLPLYYPPTVPGDTMMGTCASIMLSNDVDFLEVDMDGLKGILTVTDIIRSIDVGEIDKPALIDAHSNYPKVHPRDRLWDAVKKIRIYQVDSILVSTDESIVGVVDSRSIMEAIDSGGFEVLDKPVYRVARQVRCIADPNASVSEVASMMARTGSSICIIVARGYLVGVVDEISILEMISGERHGERLMLATAPSMGKYAS